MEIEHVADTRYDDKYKAKVQLHRALCQILREKGVKQNLYLAILEKQRIVFECLKAAMTAVGVQGSQPEVYSELSSGETKAPSLSP